MTPTASVFFVLASVALLLSPRRWATLPLLAGACYMTLGQGLQIGSLGFPVIRLLILAGIVRILLRRECPAGGWSSLDKLMCVWATWAIFSSMFHADPSATLENRLGMVYNALGVFFLVRCFCTDQEDVIRLVKMTAILLVPVALEMLNEQFTHHNLFSMFGAVSEEPVSRNERIRSQGPFAHAILAGTVGAVCAPLMIGVWKRNPKLARIGLAACLVMVITSASSGPLLSLFAGAGALIVWRWRHLTRQMRIAAVLSYILLEVVMKAPAYYLIARIRLIGGSTSWHRAALIQAAFEHLDEWWLVGTDYTRDWMPYGVGWSEDHADITNHYIAQGVKGGLPLMLLFIAILWCGFHYVGQGLRSNENSPLQDRFLIWALGASLFAHAITCTSVAYFDQSLFFLYAPLAMIVCLRLPVRSEAEVEQLLDLDDLGQGRDKSASTRTSPNPGI